MASQGVPISGTYLGDPHLATSVGGTTFGKAIGGHRLWETICGTPKEGHTRGTRWGTYIGGHRRGTPRRGTHVNRKRGTTDGGNHWGRTTGEQNRWSNLGGPHSGVQHRQPNSGEPLQRHTTGDPTRGTNLWEKQSD
jgi:hypothetical protein